MNKTTSKIVLILLVAFTATLCSLILELPSIGIDADVVLITTYALLLITSLFMPKSNTAMLLIVCGIALPLCELLWNFEDSNWIWNHVNDDIKNHLLTFSFVGISSYFITFIIAPAAAILIGDTIREHRRQKPQQ